MHQGRLAEVIRDHFVVVHIDVGRFNKNLDVAAQYGVPLSKGIPAIAVLNSHGKLLYSQRQGEFEAAHRMPSAAILAFFEKWAPAGAARPPAGSNGKATSSSAGLL